MKKYFLLFLAVCALCSLQCRKDKIPPATQEGKNTLGFTLDGQVWVPYAECGTFSDPCREISADYSSPSAAPDAIDFQFTRVNGNKSSTLTISSSGIGTITTPGEKIDSIGIVFSGENSSGNNGRYGGPLSGSKFIIIKIDKQNQIISGEFEFVLLEQNGSGNTITLKDGRFDFKFNACRCSN